MEKMRFLVPLVERREETRVEVGESLSLEREIIGSAYVIVDRTKEEERKGKISCHVVKNTQTKTRTSLSKTRGVIPSYIHRSAECSC